AREDAFHDVSDKLDYRIPENERYTYENSDDDDDFHCSEAIFLAEEIPDQFVHHATSDLHIFLSARTAGIPTMSSMAMNISIIGSNSLVDASSPSFLAAFFRISQHSSARSLSTGTSSEFPFLMF